MKHTSDNKITIRRLYDTSPELLWELWTTKDGAEAWWGPGGFKVEVGSIDLRPGGELRYKMTAVDPQMVEFMKSAGMPTSTECTLRFVRVEPCTLLEFSTRADFIPDIPSYDVNTLVQFVSQGKQTELVLTLDPMHDPIWTERQRAGRESELVKLAEIISERKSEWEAK